MWWECIVQKMVFSNFKKTGNFCSRTHFMINLRIVWPNVISTKQMLMKVGISSCMTSTEDIWTPTLEIFNRLQKKCSREVSQDTVKNWRGRGMFGLLSSPFPQWYLDPQPIYAKPSYLFQISCSSVLHVLHILFISHTTSLFLCL